MPTLANVTKETRLIIKFGGAALALLVFLILIFNGGVFLKNTFFPTPAAAPTERFGKLPAITFPQQAGNTPQFRVNTISGSLPAFPSTINVYQLIKLQPNITSLQTARGRAKSVGYTQNQRTISTEEYTWTQATANNTLDYNIISLNFSVSSDYLTNPPQGGITSDKNSLTGTVGGFIGALGSNQSDVTLGNSILSFYLISNGNLIETPDSSNANVARVYLIQNPVNQLPIYYPTANLSLLYFTLTGANTPTVVDASYIHLAPSLTSFSTYPVKTADAAYNDLSSGKGFIVNPTSDTTVDITDVSLGYYLGNQEDQTYLMPIVIFNGKNNFRAYVNALAD